MADIEIQSEPKSHFLFYYTRWVRWDGPPMVDFYRRGRFTGASKGVLNPRLVRIVEGTCKVKTKKGEEFEFI